MMAVGLLKACPECKEHYDSGLSPMFCPHCSARIGQPDPFCASNVCRHSIQSWEKRPEGMWCDDCQHILKYDLVENKWVLFSGPPPRPSWDEVWIEFAGRLAQRSTCSRASVGCVIVSEDNSVVLGLGYNGGAKGLSNECLSSEPGKCGHLHAEINALIKANYRDAAPKKAYITSEPCYPCAVALVNAGVREVVFGADYRDHSGSALLAQAGIAVRRFPPAGLPERYLSVDKDGKP